MRRHATFHDRADPWARYVQTGEILSGSIPVLDAGKVVRWFKRFEKPQGSGLVHFTLSMPDGLRLSDREWHDVASYVLDVSGLPHDLVPWAMAGREKTRCDHVHILSATQTWSGRELDVATSKRFTDALDRTVRHHLGIPELAWHLPPEASLVSPIRTFRKHDQARRFAEDFNHAMGVYLPTTLCELNSALGRVGSTWTVSGSLKPGSLLTPFDNFWQLDINPRTAGRHFSSNAIVSRLAFAKRIATARAAQFIVQLARIVHPTSIPTLRAGKKHDIPNSRQRSLESEDRLRARGHQEIAPSFNPSGAGGPRPDNWIRRKVDGVDGRDQGGLHGAGPPIQIDAPKIREPEPEVRLPVGRRRTGRGQWLIRLRLLARSLGIRIKSCFEAGGQIIKVTAAENAVMLVDLRAMTIDVDDTSAVVEIKRLRSAFLGEQSSFEPEQEASYQDDLEPF